MKRFIKISAIISLILMLCVFSFYYLIQRPRVQTYLTQKVSELVSSNVDGKVHIGSVNIKFFRRLVINDLYIEDSNQDTLLYVNQLFVRIGVLNLLRKKIELKTVAIKQPTIFIHRAENEDKFNFNFLTTANSPEKDNSHSENSYKIILKVLRIEELRLKVLDEPNNQLIQIDFKKLDINVENLDLQNKDLALQRLALSNANIVFKKLLNPEDSIRLIIPTRPQSINNSDWHVKADNIIIDRSSFKYINENRLEPQAGVDFNDIDVQHINLELSNTEIICDTVLLKIESLAAKEKSGVAINTMRANAKISTVKIECSNLQLKTDNSNIHDYFSLKYNSFADFMDFVPKVHIQGNFKHSQLSLKDINYFAKGTLDKLTHNTLKLSGNISGTIDNLKGKHLKINMGKNSTFSGSLSFKGLPHIDETFMLLEIDKIKTSYGDLKSVYPNISFPANLANLGRFTFSGDFIGFQNDFVADGNLQSVIGNIKSDFNLKIDPETKTAQYSGNFSAIDFDLGKWFNEPELIGLITANTHINGTGLKLSDVEAYMNGSIESIQLNQYDYKDININGDITERFFKGELAIHDKNLDFDFAGKIDLNDSVPIFQFTSELRKANLKILNLSEKDYWVRSNLKLDFTGNSLDNFKGYASIFNTKLDLEGQAFKVDTFLLEAHPIDGLGNKSLTLNADFVEAKFRGNFKYEKLSGTLKDIFNHYFKANYNQTSIETTENQNFDFDINIKNTQNLTQLIDPQFENFEGASIYGSFEGKKNLININADIKGATYGVAKFKNLSISSLSNEQSLSLQASIDTILYKDSLLTNNIYLNTKIKQDSIILNFAIQNDSISPNRLNLYARLETDLESINIEILPSTIIINNQNWEIADSNYIHYGANIFAIQNLIFSKEKSKLEFKTFKDPLGHTHLSVFLRDLNLNEVTSPLTQNKKINFDGIVNGTVAILNILKQPTFVASLDIDSLSINDQKIGDININSNYLAESETVDLSASLIGQENKVEIIGTYSLQKDADNLDLRCYIGNIKLDYLESFIQKDISKIKGNLQGSLKIQGAISNPIITGDLILKNVQAKINYLNTLYSFVQEEITLKKGEIDLGEILINDPENNEAQATGKIFYTNNGAVDVDVEIKTENFLFLNTNSASSESYYGTLYADALILINGPLKEIEFLVSAKTNRKTSIAIDVAQGKDTDQYNFYRFTNTTTKHKVNKTYISKEKGLTLDFNLEVTPEAEVNVIMNYDDGDVIKAIGGGDIKVNVDNYGDLSIIGEYKINDGNYLFSMQNVISKKFNMERGSSITWIGDPYTARLDINAAYRLRAAPYDLISDIIADDKEILKAKNRVTVLVTLNIQGNLAEPVIRFDIKIIDADPSIKTAIESKLQLVKSDPNELNKQVVGLLIMNRFLPQRPGSSEVKLANDVSTSVSEFISNQLSLYLSDWISEFITEVELDISYRPYSSEVTDVNNNSEFQNRQELELALSKSFMNDRISIDLGGNFDFGDNTTNGGEKATNIAGDFEIEYSITPDGRIKIRAFRKGDYDIFENRNKNKQGIGISWSKEFNNTKDLFQKSQERKTRRKTNREQKKQTNAIIDNTELKDE